MLLAVALPGCDRVQRQPASTASQSALPSPPAAAEADVAAEPPAQEPTGPSGWADDLRRSYDEKARAALERTEVAALKKSVDEMMATVKAGDWAKAESLSGPVDALLGSDIVSRTHAVLRIRAQEGAEAAESKLTEYLAAPALPEAQRKYYADLKSRIASIPPEQIDEGIRFTVIAVGIACEMKFGHGGAALPVFVMNALFPDKARELFGTSPARPLPPTAPVPPSAR